MTVSKIFLYLCLAFIAGVFVFTNEGGRTSDEGGSASDGGAPDGGTVSLVSIVAEEPDIREKSQKLTIKYYENGSRDIIEGKILATTRRYPEYKYGDKLEITGRPQKPSEDIDGFNYRNYLRKDGIYYTMSFPKIESVGSGFGNPIVSLLLSFKNRFKESARSFISPPQIGFLEALVFGDEGEISDAWKEKLNLTGTRHIAAVSGMNITIISGIILNFLLLLGFWRGQAFYISIVFIILYILMIGAPASAVRAGVMAGLFLTARHLGRSSLASRAVVFAAALMLAFNPLLLRLDVGFQLSFLAMMGLIYLQPAFSEWLKKIPDCKFFPIRTTLAATLSAQVFTAPILIYNFGYVSLVSVLANVLIVPLLAPLTILLFVFGLAGIIFWPLAWLLSWPAFFALSYIVKIIDLFFGLSSVSLRIENLSWVWLAISYLILGFLAWKLEKLQRLKILKY